MVVEVDYDVVIVGGKIGESVFEEGVDLGFVEWSCGGLGICG